ncbi:MAG: 50S ribosomal protein P1 [Methanomassiliicoccales archaeon]
MEYIYSALVLHAAGKQISEESIVNVLKAAGVEADAAKVKALTASLEGVDIGEAIKAAAVVAAPVAVAAAAAAPKVEEKKEEPAVTEDEAAAGLSALFG